MLSHAMFVNSSLDSNYPYVNLSLGMDLSSQESDQRWIIRPGKSDSSKKSYVSIESYNKPGLYITAVNKLLKLSQNFNGTMTDTQTFKTVKDLMEKVFRLRAYPLLECILPMHPEKY